MLSRGGVLLVITTFLFPFSVTAVEPMLECIQIQSNGTVQKIERALTANPGPQTFTIELRAGATELVKALQISSLVTSEEIRVRGARLQIVSECGLQGGSVGSVTICVDVPAGRGPVCGVKIPKDKAETLATVAAAASGPNPADAMRRLSGGTASSLAERIRTMDPRLLSTFRFPPEIRTLLEQSGLPIEHIPTLEQELRRNPRKLSDLLSAIAAGNTTAVRRETDSLRATVSNRSWGTITINSRALAEGMVRLYAPDPGRLENVLPQVVRTAIAAPVVDAEVSGFICGVTAPCAADVVGRVTGFDPPPLPDDAARRLLARTGVALPVNPDAVQPAAPPSLVSVSPPPLTRESAPTAGDIVGRTAGTPSFSEANPFRSIFSGLGSLTQTNYSGIGSSGLSGLFSSLFARINPVPLVASAPMPSAVISPPLPPSIALFSRPRGSVTRGSRVVVTWAAAGVSTTEPCVLSEATRGDTLLARGNSGSFALVVPQDAITALVPVIRCTPADSRVSSKDAEKSIIIRIQ
ncbi:MAG: hypothetical protein AAB421_02985 [Patescibacteria group bacterium]